MAGILLIDDDPDIRVSLAELLRLEGYPVVTACNGEEGLEKLKSNSLPCVILLDLMMPIMDGWEFRAKQLSEPDLAQLPVVIISATTEIRRHAFELKAAGFVSKPFVLDRLLSVLQRYCQALPPG